MKRNEHHQDGPLYDYSGPGATFAARRDADFFAAHPEATWRVRPLIEGESPIADMALSRGLARRAYAVVVFHTRAGDKRAHMGHGIYPIVVTKDMTRPAMQRLLRREAKRLMRSFATSAKAPAATVGTAIITAVEG